MSLSESEKLVTPESGKKNDHNKRKALVAGGIGAALLALIFGVVANSNDSSPAQKSEPAATAPANPSPTSTPESSPSATDNFEYPAVDLSNTGYNSVSEVSTYIESLGMMNDKSQNLAAFIDAANGNPSELNSQGISIGNIAIDYVSAAEYIKQLAPISNQLSAEDKIWEKQNPFGPYKTFKNVEALQYILGTILEKQKSGQITLTAKGLAKGRSASDVAPMDYYLNMSGDAYTLLIDNPGPQDITNLKGIIEQLKVQEAAAQAAGLVATAKGYKVMYDLDNPENPFVVNLINTYNK